MEELFCIGCGAQIQTEDKEKLKKQVSCTVNVVSAFVITMKLWMSTSQMMNF